MKRLIWVGFGVFCLLSSSEWLIPVASQGELPFLERQSLLYACAGVVGIILGGRGTRTQVIGLQQAGVAAAGVLFFGGPTLLLAWASSGVSAVNRAAAFALLPAVVVQAILIRGNADDEKEGRGLFGPALAAFGGALLLLPVDLPVSSRSRTMLVLVCVAVGLVAFAGVWMHHLLQGLAIGDALAIACFANAVFLLLYCLATGDFVSTWSGIRTVLSVASLSGLVELILLIWLLRDMSPIRFAGRALMVPLLTVLEGYAVLRPAVTVRFVAGVMLLIGGAGRILFSKADDEAPLSLR